jgi:hypothetical protein
MNNTLERIWQETWHLPGRTEQKHDKTVKYPISVPRSETENSQTRSRAANNPAATSDYSHFTLITFTVDTPSDKAMRFEKSVPT